MKAGFAFEVQERAGAARRGRLLTPHGVVETPAFMPVATYGAVRGVSASELEALGAQILLANTYHLHERPGEAIVAGCGGLHGFTGWHKPWLTDSGGFQITSLADRVRIDEEGVSFHSPLDGRHRLLSPERAMEIQGALGADVAMVLDECRPPSESGDEGLRERVSMERTLRWAERCQRAHSRPDQLLFGIVQGGASKGLRRESARASAALGFDGYAHGGLGLGEAPPLREELIGEVHGMLPPEAPRYLMGLGAPEDLIDAVAWGIDLFDCVIPTRHARHGVLYTSRGFLHVRNARFRDDPAPPDEECECSTCTRHSRAYLRHLLHVNEILGASLASVHNLRFTLKLLEAARNAIGRGELAELAELARRSSRQRVE